MSRIDSLICCVHQSATNFFFSIWFGVSSAFRFWFPFVEVEQPKKKNRKKETARFASRCCCYLHKKLSALSDEFWNLHMRRCLNTMRFASLRRSVINVFNRAPPNIFWCHFQRNWAKKWKSSRTHLNVEFTNCPKYEYSVILCSVALWSSLPRFNRGMVRAIFHISALICNDWTEEARGGELNGKFQFL